MKITETKIWLFFVCFGLLWFGFQALARLIMRKRVLRSLTNTKNESMDITTDPAAFQK